MKKKTKQNNKTSIEIWYHFHIHEKSSRVHIGKVSFFFVFAHSSGWLNIKPMPARYNYYRRCMIETVDGLNVEKRTPPYYNLVGTSIWIKISFDAGIVLVHIIVENNRICFSEHTQTHTIAEQSAVFSLV